MTRSLLIVGAGYTGRRISERVSRETRKHFSLARTPEKAKLGTAIVADLDDKSSLVDALAQHDFGAAVDLIYLVPPRTEDDCEQRLPALLAALPVPVRRLVLASTTGVYGDHGGAIVDESTPVTPITDRAKARVALEQSARDAAEDQGFSLCILRIAGIYGPGRLPLEAIRSGQPIIDPAESGPGNRIHVEDLASACLRALDVESPPDIVNVCDGDARSASDFTLKVAQLAGLPPPPTIAASDADQHFSPMRLSFLNESRQVSNRRLIESLGVELRYPSADAGIEAILAADA